MFGYTKYPAVSPALSVFFCWVNGLRLLGFWWLVFPHMSTGHTEWGNPQTYAHEISWSMLGTAAVDNRYWSIIGSFRYLYTSSNYSSDPEKHEYTKNTGSKPLSINHPIGPKATQRSNIITCACASYAHVLLHQHLYTFPSTGQL